GKQHRTLLFRISLINQTLWRENSSRRRISLESESASGAFNGQVWPRQIEKMELAVIVPHLDRRLLSRNCDDLPPTITARIDRVSSKHVNVVISHRSICFAIDVAEVTVACQ